MVIWLNGAFGSGKTTTAVELNRRLPGSYIYDPENVGYFIRRNTPGLFSAGDFQDIPLWREMNYKMLKMTAEKYNGTIIVPMTLANPVYYDEIIGKLAACGVEVKHFILYAGHEEIARRIKRRTIPFFGRDTFATDSIDRCVTAFDSLITETKIYTENMSVDEVVEKIAELCGLPLAAGRKTKIGKVVNRVKMFLVNYRYFFKT